MTAAVLADSTMVVLREADGAWTLTGWGLVWLLVLASIIGSRR